VVKAARPSPTRLSDYRGATEGRPRVFGATEMADEELLAEARALLDLCRAKTLTIATAESCTGGRVAATLTEIPGSSDVVGRGFVTYSNAAKTAMVGVPADIIARFGAVSRETAEAMAQGALAHSPADLAVS